MKKVMITVDERTRELLKYISKEKGMTFQGYMKLLAEEQSQKLINERNEKQQKTIDFGEN